MSDYLYYLPYGSTPSLPVSCYVRDGNFQKQLLAGVTGVTITVWSAQGPRTAVPVGAPIISAAAGSAVSDLSAAPGPYTLLQYQPTHADALHPVGSYVFQFTVSSTGGKVDIIPSNNSYGTLLIGAAGP